jgi:UDP-GlcNAc3NAcA epimerase
MQERPDAVVVFGDTNSTLAGALAASKLRIPVAHVEAGLRSGDRAMPEEVNRVLTDHISDWMFAPTQGARQNLLREGRPAEQIHVVGDIMLDVARLYAPRAQAQSHILEALAVSPGDFALVTVHRASNTDDAARLGVIVEALCAFASQRALVWPLHPRTQGALARLGLLERVKAALTVVEPVGYLDMLRLTQGARLVITDSGGLQKEAFFHETPCLTLRDHTEWRELLDLGWNRLLPPRDAATLLGALQEAWSAPTPTEAPAVYGTGDSAQSIVRVLREDLA